MDLSLGLDRRQQLWEEVGPLFSRPEARAQLLQRLLPRITAGRLPALAPEVMQVWTCGLLWGVFGRACDPLFLLTSGVTVAHLAAMHPAHTRHSCLLALCTQPVHAMRRQPELVVTCMLHAEAGLHGMQACKVASIISA